MQPSHTRSVGQRLRRERQRLNWSQRRLAEAIGATSMSINRWEHDKAIPQLHYREQLCTVFHTSADVLFGMSSTEEGNPPAFRPIWHVPSVRHPLFTGRTLILERLHESLRPEGGTAFTGVCAITGLGGIGKTQTAIEYAYRYREDYQAILWLRAETRETLLADFAGLAAPLHLQEADERDQQHIVEVVKCWLGDHQQWLLIFDNMEDSALLRDILPLEPSGHLLLTTRLQATGSLVERIDLEPMNPEEGALLLLRRAKHLAPAAPLEEATSADRHTAREISLLMDGLPLALDQAGAYLEETACGLSMYLDHYQKRRASLLARRGDGGGDHPHSVTTTFSLAIERVEQVNSVAADLLRLCAFLHPDAIPEELIADGVCELDPVLGPTGADPLALDAAIKDLRTFSLLQRTPETKTLTVHRLVQAVIKEGMDENTQRQWAERVVRMVGWTFPGDDYTPLELKRRFLPHAHVCLDLIKHWHLHSPEAADVLAHLGQFFNLCAQHEQAEPLLRQALAMRSDVLGLAHPDVAQLLHTLGLLLMNRGTYAEAGSLFQQALALREQALGAQHPDVAKSLNSLAVLSAFQSQYARAEALFRQVLAMREQVLEPTHPDLAQSLGNLGEISYLQGHYAQAEPLYQRALTIYEQRFGHAHASVALTLAQLSLLLSHQEQYELAEAYGREALTVAEQVWGPMHPRVAETLLALSSLSLAQGKWEQGTAYGLQARTIIEQTLGSEHPDLAKVLDLLARCSQGQGKHVQAELLYQRTLAIYELRQEQAHAETVRTLEHYAGCLREMERHEEAKQVEARVRELRARQTQAHPTRQAEKVSAAGFFPQESNLLDDFFAVCCEFHPQVWSRAGDLWRAYQQWAQNRGEGFPLSRHMFTEQLKAKGCLATRTNTSRIWRGITLRDTA